MFTVIGAGAVTVAAVQVPFGIVVAHMKLTLGAKPAGAGEGTVATFAPNDPELFVTVTEGGSPVTAKSPPAPLNVVCCMAPPEVTVSVPASAPVAVGVNVTLRVQVLFGGAPTLPLQMSFSPKLALGVTVNAIAAPLVFVSVTC